MDQRNLSQTDTFSPSLGQTDAFLGVNGLYINEDERTFLNKLEKFEAPYMEEKLSVDKQFETKAQFTESFVEFKKFVALTRLSGKTMAMISKDVDKIWHQFILFTPQYHEFCDEFLGKYLHHVPKTSLTPLASNGINAFREAYEKYFGKIPRIWEAQANGTDDCSDIGSSGMCHGDGDCGGDGE